ncbi:MAG: glutamate--tRNA ligase, partial [Burkholderiaceae bacterium]|nr:glutamate--tRNA ligase [Burkholderiaceae bacterium]
MFYGEPHLSASELAEHVKPGLRPVLRAFADTCGRIEWSREAIGSAIKATIAEHGLKMPQFAVPVRMLVFGRAQTPSLDAMLALAPRERVIHRLAGGVAHAM